MDASVEMRTMSGVAPDVEIGDNQCDYCSWLAPRVLVLAGRPEVEEGDELTGAFSTKREVSQVVVRSLRLTSRKSGNRDAPEWLFAVQIPTSESLKDDGSLELVDGRGRTVLGPVHLEAELTDLRTTLRGGLAWLDARTREQVLAFLTATRDSLGPDSENMEFGRNLRRVRDALRERLPLVVVSRDDSRGLTADALLAIDERAFYVDGWMQDEEAPIVRLTAVSPEGERVDLQDRLFPYRRPDVEEFYGTRSLRYPDVRQGFMAFFELDRPSRLRKGWILELENAEGVAVEVHAPPVLQDLTEVRKRILGGLPPTFPVSNELMERHIHPAISRLQKRAEESVRVQEVIDYGLVPRDARVSIVVPLYRRIDFLEHQLAQFVHDPEMQKSELIYVLDSPELARALTEKAAQLHGLYRIPFRVVLLERNSGFAAANNCGVSVASAPLVLFLNSDVLPCQPGWLGSMTDFYESQPCIGALGAKLLYEDDTLQHAGMYFARPTTARFAGLWMNQHYFKGLHRNLPAANVARAVPAVTGACLMLARERFAEVGGFQNIYVQGDHEDSDLCLRLTGEGLENWYLPDVELYHLEAQSYPSDLRERTLLYNCWLHTREWGERIREIMDKEGQHRA